MHCRSLDRHVQTRSLARGLRILECSTKNRFPHWAQGTGNAVHGEENSGAPLGFDCLSWAWKQATNSKLVLVALSESANDETGECWPGLRLIATRCNLQVRAVQRAIKNLSDEKLIEVTPHFRADGTQTSNTYRLCLPTIPKTTTYPVASDTVPLSPATPLEPEVEPSRDIAAAPPPKKLAVRSAAPDRLDVTESMRVWAVKNGVSVDLESETEAMLDHHRGKGNLHLDWVATWRTWMRNSIKFGTKKGNPPQQSAAAKPKTPEEIKAYFLVPPKCAL